MKHHHYKTTIDWTGNDGAGTKNYNSYSRKYTITADGKEHVIEGSSDPSFRGDSRYYNPEDLFLSSISGCHMLWYLHLCSVNNIIVTKYQDKATGTMEEGKDGSGKFIDVTLNPIVMVAKPVDEILVKTLHKEANEKCFIANSCNFEIHHNVTVNYDSSLQN